MEQKKLYKLREGKIVDGVCGGIAEYAGIDPTIVRVAWALGSIFTVGAGGVFAYLICSLIIPRKPPMFW